MEISPELARIHAHLCGDGFSCIWKTKSKDRIFIAVTGYCNNNQNLLDKFRQDFSSIFNVKMKMRTGREVSIKSKRIFKELANNFGSFGSRKWRIPSSIKISKEEMNLPITASCGVSCFRKNLWN